MAVRVTCPNPDCRASAGVEEQSLGRRARCKKCGHAFALARPDGEPASRGSGDASAWKRATPAGPTDLPEAFGRYRIMGKVGQGGMGSVYLAHDTRLDRQVALKVPYFHPAEGPLAVQRFEREARAAATLDHPNLCPIYDVGEVDGTPYLTMPYIEGKTLAEVIARDRTFAEPRAVAVTRKLALALHEAHERGVVHRDLKPGNVMVNRRRDLIIMDFGLARVGDGDDRPLTGTGHVLGTALYMAPEQAAGEAAIGPAADVYSLGVILYELLTGRRPFEGPWSLVIGLKSVKDPEPPSAHRPGLGPALDALCLKAIAREPKDRYPTMAAFAEALGAFAAPGVGPPSTSSGEGLDDEGPASPGPASTAVDGASDRHRRRSRALGLALLIGLALGVVLLVATRPSPTDGDGAATADPAPITAVDSSPPPPTFASTVPGRWVHTAASLDGEHDFRPDGSIELYGDVHGSWSVDGHRLTLRWPNPLAPGGAWVDEALLDAEGRFYEGRNQRGEYIRGRKVSR